MDIRVWFIGMSGKRQQTHAEQVGKVNGGALVITIHSKKNEIYERDYIYITTV